MKGVSHQAENRTEVSGACLHKRQAIDDDLAELAYYLNEDRRHLILLPRPYDLMPAGIAAQLIELGIPGDRQMLVYQRLTLEGEKRWEGTLKQCADSKEEFSDLTIMIFPHGEIEVSGQGE